MSTNDSRRAASDLLRASAAASRADGRSGRVERPVLLARGVKRWCFLALAGGSVVLGVVGLLLPGLPCTPFLLLASYFLIRSSPRLHAALLRSKLLGPVLTDWQVHGGVRRHVKWKAVGAVAIGVTATIYLTGQALSPTVGVLVLASIGIAVILRLPEARPPQAP